jgi:hypothetical protein
MDERPNEGMNQSKRGVEGAHDAFGVIDVRFAGYACCWADICGI